MIEIITPELSCDEIRNKFALNGKFVFGFIGTFSTWHGVELLCKVIVNFFKKYPKENARVRFLLIGERAFVADLQGVYTTKSML